jgi:N-acyl homoserine lactone hydrolase
MAMYSIWVLEYAYVPSAPAGGVVYGAHTEPPRKVPYGYVLIKGNGTLAMVDVGYNHQAYGREMADRFGVHGWQPASAVLAEAGVSPADVQHVFLTHAHFDHAGNTDSFPNATFYLQERELSKWVWAQSLDQRFRWLMTATDPGDIARIGALAGQGRLVSIDGDREDVLPGIDIRAAHDTHTWGCQYVTVRNDGRRESEDTWVLAGDLVYSYDNLRGMDPLSPNYIPVGLAIESQCNLLFATDAMIQAAGGDYKRVVPVHEDRLSAEFPSRITKAGLRIIEIALADSDQSLVS